MGLAVGILGLGVVFLMLLFPTAGVRMLLKQGFGSFGVEDLLQLERGLRGCWPAFGREEAWMNNKDVRGPRY